MKTTKRIYLALVVGLMASLLAVALPKSALANGGTIIFSNDVGNFNVLVTETPSPPTPDAETHLSVLLTKRNSDAMVTDATVIFNPDMPSMAMQGQGSKRAFPGQAPNTYDINLTLGMEGSWVVHVTVHSPTYGDAQFDVNLSVEKPSAPWPFIIAILVGLPVLAFLTWWLLFRKQSDDDDDDDEPGVKANKAQPTNASNQP